MRLSIIIPTFRRFDALVSTVADLLKQDYSDYEIIIVDQNEEWPADSQVKWSRMSADPRINWIKGFPPGVVCARNHAASIATGEILVFVDDDVVIEDPRFLAGHAACYTDPAVSAVTGCELYLESVELSQIRKNSSKPPKVTTDDSWVQKPLLEQVLTFSRRALVPTRVCSFCTCNASVRKTAFEVVGGFDEQFVGNAYGDDYDFAIRLCTAGMQILYSPGAWLIHLQSPMGGLRMSDLKNQTTEFERSVSPLLFFFRHGRFGWYRFLLYHHVLRKTVLSKDNVVNPWRQFPAWWGLLSAVPVALRAARNN